MHRQGRRDEARTCPCGPCPPLRGASPLLPVPQRGERGPPLRRAHAQPARRRHGPHLQSAEDDGCKPGGEQSRAQHGGGHATH